MYERVPNELKALKQWVCYSLVDDGTDKQGNPKKKKVPISPRGGIFAKSNDDSTWDTFERAVEGEERLHADGIGLMFANGICGVDIDHCIDGGELSHMAQEIVDTLQSYAEISPSGTGIHILCKGRMPKEPGRRNKEGLEMYDTGRYFTVTGNAYCDAEGNPYPLRDCTAEIDRIHKKYIYNPPAQTTETKDTKPVSRGGKVRDLSDDEILKIAFNAVGGDKLRKLYDGDYSEAGGDGSHSAGDIALCNKLAFWFNKDKERMDAAFRNSGMMRDKWDRRQSGTTYGSITLDRAIRDCKEGFEPIDRPAKRRKSMAPPPATPPQTKARKQAFPFDSDDILPDTTLYTLDDTGNAYRFRDTYYSDIKFNHIDKCWYHWDGRRWSEDITGEIKRMADTLLMNMQDEAKANEDMQLLKHVRRTRSSKAKEAMIKETQHMKGIPILPNEMDRYLNAINVLNGVVDLKTGQLRAHHRKYKMSMLANVTYDKNAQCNTWIKFLYDVTNGDEQLMLYLKRMAGYCLTGSTKEQCVFFVYGLGGNGKSVFIDTISTLMGEYAKNSQPETLMMRDKGNNAARTDIARLKGARMVTTFEPNEGSRIDEGMIKQLSGEDMITARMLYKSEFEFKPEFKIIMATNIKPIITGKDEGIWRRIRMIPFTVQIPEEKRDGDLKEKLKAEMPGIFNWALEGAAGWYKHGMPRCAVVDEASRNYRTEMDKIQQFIDDCLERRAGSTLQSSAVYEVYKLWCAELGERYPISNTKFSMELKKRFEWKKTSMYNEYVDIGYTDKGTRLLTTSPYHSA